MISPDATPNPSRSHPGTTRVAVAVIFRRRVDGSFQFLAALRTPDVPRGNLWEFPGGKVDHDETMHEAVHREVREELDIELPDGVPFCIEHDDDPTQSRERSVELHAFAFDATDITLAPKPLASREVRWLDDTQFDELDWPRANAGIFTAFRSWLRQRDPG